MNRIDTTDSKIEGILDGASHFIYLGCDHNAQSILQQADQNGYIDSNGDDSDPSRSTIVSTILEIVPKNTPSERVRNELVCLKDVNKCSRCPVLRID